MTTDTASCAAPVSLSVRVLPDNNFSPSPQSIRSFYADRHRLLRRSRESFCPSSSRCVHFPCAPPTPLTTTLLSLSVLVGGGGWFFYLAPLEHDRLRRPAVSVCPSLGFLLFIPGPPHVPSTFLYLSVLVGRDGFEQPPLAHPRLRRGPRSDRGR